MITVIGLGEVGLATFKAISEKKDVHGVDIDKELIERLKSEGLNVFTEMPRKSDAYIIAVYSSQQVLDVMEKINYENKPLVIIESTLEPGTVDKIKDKNCDLVLFPHRFNSDDPEHAVFNLDRVMGGLTEEAVNKAIEFYSKFIDKKLIHTFPIDIVELSKPLENAYRFTEIAIAEELNILCDEKNIDFKKLREAANTKWNINIKEARNGIDGKCLPKDTKIINEFFNDNKIFNNSINTDQKYTKKANKE